ncbi:MAG: hypothetical protein BLM47_14335, partial [Candidatus Reconcilbacillus cellulovorans]
RTFLELPYGIPSHDTFGRVFSLLSPEAFEQAFMAWTQEIFRLTQGAVIAIDGKTLRRSHDQASGRKPLHLVQAWASGNGIVLAQRKVDAIKRRCWRKCRRSLRMRRSWSFEGSNMRMPKRSTKVMAGWRFGSTG